MNEELSAIRNIKYLSSIKGYHNQLVFGRRIVIKRRSITDTPKYSMWNCVGQRSTFADRNMCVDH